MASLVRALGQVTSLVRARGQMASLVHLRSMVSMDSTISIISIRFFCFCVAKMPLLG